MPAEPPVVSPRTLREACELLAERPHRLLAGGTDLLVQLTGEVGPVPERVLDLWQLQELRGIARRGAMLDLGALSTYTDIRRSALCREHASSLVEAAATIGAVQIQHRGTIGGNVMNASPAGDTLPVLLALDAVLVLVSVAGERAVAATDFWPAYRRTAARPDEVLARVRIPIVPDREQRFRKVGTRRAQAISKVVVAASWREDLGRAGSGGEPGVVARGGGPGRLGPWRDVRIALGSVAPIPIRVAAAEAELGSRERSLDVIDAAVEALGRTIQPIDDVRSTAAYRREVARRVVRRLLVEAAGLEPDAILGGAA
jgi:CO/xanthine dehydrogenase FAD-binding subunit